MTRRRFSIGGRVAFLVIANAFVSTLIAFFTARVAILMGYTISIWHVAASLLVAVPVAIYSSRAATGRFTRMLTALGDGVRGFRDEDFGLRLAARGNDEVSDLIHLYNQVGDVLRSERSAIYQKELLLDTILQRTPMAVVLVSSFDRIIYSNSAAREMFRRGARLDGETFATVVDDLADPMKAALAAGGDSMFSLTTNDHDETFHLTSRTFFLNAQRHKLVMLERLTPELRRQEISVWKKAIRTINHELNNSLAPISSLFHSARHVQQRPEQHHRLPEIYDTIEERLEYLRLFLEGYAKFARLPLPRKARVRWDEVLDEARRFYPFQLEGAHPGEGVFDRTQIQQVLINLLKNANESGSDPSEIVVSVSNFGEGTLLRVMDRGRGMDEETMRQALLPFYSTKQDGTGLGLALCNEIIDAHGGRLHLQVREGKGVSVSCWLPQ